MIKPILPAISGALALMGSLGAQVLDPPGSAPAQPAAKPPAPGESSFLGKDIPSFDPGSNIITWDGKSWNVTNNEFFEARFEKYLNAPEETDEQDRKYNAIIESILDTLSPNRVNSKALDQAFELLPQASEFRRDAGLCDTIANQVFSAWLARRNQDRMISATQSLDGERGRLERNQRLAAEGRKLTPPPRKDDPVEVAKAWAEEQRALRDVEMQPFITRLAEINALMKTTNAKRELQELQTKIEFQTLIVQLLLQRRFQHVLIATRFYRHVFADGDNKLRIDGDAKDLFANTTGMPPTVGTLDAMASEIIRDASEGIDAYEYLLSKDELESATKRLAETFMIGEYLPQVRTVKRDDKRQSLAFVQKSNQLISALEVRDYTLAEKLVKDLEKTARDFDNSKPMAAIQTAKVGAAFHLAKAKNAAVAGDKDVLEAELESATIVWPRNPELAEISKLIFSQGDVQNKALVDFDQLISQKNHRQIYDEKERFIAATAMDSARQDQLRQVLTDMATIESAIIRAQEIQKRGDFAGAWESAEQAFQNFPDDAKLNQIRANLTTQTADFVQALRRAEDLEKRGQTGSSLAWFLKAQREYPNSDFAKAGIERMTRQILPDAS